MSKKKKIILGLVGFLCILQLVPVERTNPPVKGGAPMTPEVRVVLARACLDCHSNETKWPWYAYVAPVSFLIAHDVNEGRRELNLSEWNMYSDKKKDHKAKEVVEMVESGEMPLPIYPPLHPEAKLSDQDKKVLVEWAKTVTSTQAQAG